MDPEKEAAKRGWVYTYDLGVIDEKIVEELVDKMQGWKREDIWEALKREGDNQIKVAFQLVRDHRRMLKGGECYRSFSSSRSGPRWEVGEEMRGREGEGERGRVWNRS